MLSLHDREWKEFFIGSLFLVKRPMARSENQYSAGKVPFVASGNVNNGVIRCCAPQLKERLDKGNCITVSPVDGSAFYQENNFLGRGGAGSSILLLYNSHINKYSGLFIAKMIRQTCSKYHYGKMGSQERIRREKTMLPVDEQGYPDYDFMEQYIREREKQIIQDCVSYIGNSIQTECRITPPHKKEWKEHRLLDFFYNIKGNQNNMAELETGTFPLVSARNTNNGYKDFVSPHNNKAAICGHCLTINNDGDGGAGISFYQPFDMLLDTHVTALIPKTEMSMEQLLFISSCITIQREKFGHGYSLNNARLSVFRIMLPIDGSGLPDWSYMEQYSKMLINRLKLQYLQSKMTT